MTMEPAKMSGPIVAAAFSWIRSHYGNGIIDKALAKLPEEDRNQFKKLILSIGWYDIATFEKFCDACYEEIESLTGESRETFDRKGIEEGGGAILKTIYKFIVSITQPVNTINRISTLFKRTYSQGEVSVIENSVGHCIIHFNIPEEMLPTIRKNNKFGYPHLLKMAGATQVQVETKETRISTGYQCIVEIAYQ